MWFRIFKFYHIPVVFIPLFRVSMLHLMKIEAQKKNIIQLESRRYFTGEMS